MQNLSFQKFKKHLVEAKDDSPKETAEFKKLSPAEKMAVKDIYAMIGKTKGKDTANINAPNTPPNAETVKAAPNALAAFPC